MTAGRISEGRLAAPALPHLHAHKSEVVAETAAAMHAFDLAHVLMLAGAGLIPHEGAAAIVACLVAIPADGIVAARQAAGGGNHAGEKLLTARLGPDIGGLIGLARSSGDLSAVSIRSYLRAQVLALGEALGGARMALIDFAEAHADTVTIGMTHGQHGQPTTLGHWALMIEAMLARGMARLAALWPRINRSPAGSGIMTGSEFAIDRAQVAAWLGFDGLHLHTMDAVLSHDPELEYASVLLGIAQDLARFADDLLVWSTYEFGGIELPDWFCGTSSLMPQKKNPDGLEDLKSLAHEALALVSLLATTERGATGAVIIERRTSDEALRRCSARLGARIAVIAPLLRDLEVRRERLLALAGANWAQASDVAAWLVRAGGLDWRRAHGLTGALIRRSLAAGVTPQHVTIAHLEAAAAEMAVALPALDPAGLAAALDPAACVARRQTPGGPAPASVRAMAATARGEVAAALAEIVDRRAGLAAAAAALDAAAGSFLGT